MFRNPPRGLAVNRTDERAAQEMCSGRGVDAAAYDLTAIPQYVVSAEESRSAQPSARKAASKQLVVGNIPAQRPGFQPRPDLLAQLNRVRREPSLAQVLIGTPGVGKTQLAAAYVRAKLAAGWRLVAWVNAESPASLLAGLAATADVAGLSDGGSKRSQADAGLALRRWLEADGNCCLLVFDGAIDPDVLRPFVPVRGAARVLITAAWESAADLGTNVTVDVFSPEEALALLEGRTALVDEAGATAAASALGYLPLALDQAAAVIPGQHLSYGAYLGRLRAPLGDFLPLGAEPYPPGAAEAVSLSLEALRTADEVGVGAGVLEIMALLSSAGVSRELLGAAGEAGALAAGGRRVAAFVVDQALARLDDQALLTLTIDGQTVIMHGLVARMVRERMIQRQRLTAVCRAAASVLEARAEAMIGSQDRLAVRGIPEQCAALLGYAGEADEELARVLLRLRFLALYHLIELGDSMSQAIAVGESLTADLERMLGPDHPDTLNAANSLAAAYDAAGLAAEAVPLFEQTLVGRVRLLGHDHPDTLTSQNNLAAAYQDAGRAVEAIFLFKLTLAARERLLGANHPSTLNSRGNLAATFRDVGRIAEATPFFEQTLAARERLLGTDHSDTLRSRSSLAAVYLAADRGIEALLLLEDNLAAYEQLLGADHPRTQAARNEVALAYQKVSQTEQATPTSNLDGQAKRQAYGVLDGDGDVVRDGEGEGDLECEGDGDGDFDGSEDFDGVGERDSDGDVSVRMVGEADGTYGEGV